MSGSGGDPFTGLLQGSAELLALPKRVKTLIIDDDADIRDGLRGIIESLGAEVVGEADNGRSGIERAQSLQPDLVLLDVSMPVMGGFPAARELRAMMPALAIIFVSQHNERVYAEEALRIGAGYVLKRSASADLPEAIDAAISGRTFVSRLINGRSVHSKSSLSML